MLSIRKMSDRSNVYGAFAEDGTPVFCLEQKGSECDIREYSDDQQCRGRLLVTFIGPNCLEEARQWMSQERRSRPRDGIGIGS